MGDNVLHIRRLEDSKPLCEIEGDIDDFVMTDNGEGDWCRKCSAVLGESNATCDVKGCEEVCEPNGYCANHQGR